MEFSRNLPQEDQQNFRINYGHVTLQKEIQEGKQFYPFYVDSVHSHSSILSILFFMQKYTCKALLSLKQLNSYIRVR